jgi:hypothetical protein
MDVPEWCIFPVLTILKTHQSDNINDLINCLIEKSKDQTCYLQTAEYVCTNLPLFDESSLSPSALSNVNFVGKNFIGDDSFYVLRLEKGGQIYRTIQYKNDVFIEAQLKCTLFRTDPDFEFILMYANLPEADYYQIERSVEKITDPSTNQQ